MRRKFRCATYLFVLLIAIFSQFNGAAQSFAAQDYTRIYNQVLQDAMLAEDNEICRSLVSIDQKNKNLIWKDDRVLVVTSTRYPESYPVGKEVTTWWGDIWVTAAPELKDFISKNILYKVNTLRVEQLLGLPPESGYKSFADSRLSYEDWELRWYELFEKLDLEGYDSLNPDEKLWFNVRVLIDSVNNGGIISFYYNSGADYLEDTMEDLQKLDATDVLDILVKMNELFPNGKPPKGNDERNEIISSWEDDGVYDICLKN